MRNILVVLILCLSCQTIKVKSQNAPIVEFNQFNENGVRKGLWIENKGQRTEFKYYKNGILDGPCWIMSSNDNHVLAIGRFENSKYAGVWYNFDDEGHLLSVQKNFKETIIQIPSKHKANGFCSNLCYCIHYYSNGFIKSEGLLLWNVSPDSDFTFEYGEWKYYNDDGTLMYTKNW